MQEVVTSSSVIVRVEKDLSPHS
uniref:Uncharacterized protein n=1 Tax=Rhizophora mucronata TaxID=61149 RepID=A0A2P2PKU6_RHIMU